MNGELQVRGTEDGVATCDTYRGVQFGPRNRQRRTVHLAVEANSIAYDPPRRARFGTWDLALVELHAMGRAFVQLPPGLSVINAPPNTVQLIERRHGMEDHVVNLVGNLEIRVPPAPVVVMLSFPLELLQLVPGRITVWPPPAQGAPKMEAGL